MGHRQPKYAPPYQRPSGDDDGPPDPDKGKDLWGLVPQLAVPAPWNSNPPSFNDDPPASPAGGGEPPKDIPPTWEFKVDLGGLRGCMNTLLAQVQPAVNSYQALRDLVFRDKDSVFGQNATVTTTHEPSAASQVSGGPTQPYNTEDPSPIQNSAREFAASINPAQEKVLQQTANALELVGRFIAGLDRAGQSYGAADRKTEFPEPPPNPVTRA